MKNLINITVGELIRGVRYKVIPIGIATSVLWLILLFITRKSGEGEMLTSLLIFTDATMMSVILLGATIFFERQEGSLRSIIVSPVSITQITLSKIACAVVVGLISAVIVGIGGSIIFKLNTNFILLFIYIILISASHAVLGLVLSLKSKDFNAMLVNFMGFMLLFIMPSLLSIFGIIPKQLDYIILISPSYASQLLINSALGIKEDIAKVVLSLLYLSLIIFVLTKYYVLPRLKANIMKG